MNSNIIYSRPNYKELDFIQISISHLYHFCSVLDDISFSKEITRYIPTTTTTTLYSDRQPEWVYLFHNSWHIVKRVVRRYYESEGQGVFCEVFSRDDREVTFMILQPFSFLSKLRNNGDTRRYVDMEAGNQWQRTSGRYGMLRETLNFGHSRPGG